MSGQPVIKQPGSRSCFVCGRENPHGLKLEFFTQAPGVVVANYTVSPDYQGYPGVVHGGIIASMLDEATGRSVMDGSPSGFTVTSQLSIRYRKPVPVGQPIQVIGRAGDRRGRVSKATGEIRGQDGAILAVADAVMVDIPESAVAGMDPELIGWKVYPDQPEESV
jgi:acyl-coenzyme A thioesterase PaaI-like protein